MTLRKCSQCHETKPLSDFYENKTASSGYFSKCKICVKARQLAWNKTEAGQATIAKFRETHKDDLKIYHATYEQTKKAKLNRRKYRQSDKGKEAKKRYYIRRYGSMENYWKQMRAKLKHKETPEQTIAWRKVMHAIESGKLVRQPCQCGNPKSQAHHPDYSKPLDVEWLCSSCHQKHHTEKYTVNDFVEHPEVCTTKRRSKPTPSQ